MAATVSGGQPPSSLGLCPPGEGDVATPRVYAPASADPLPPTPMRWASALASRVLASPAVRASGVERAQLRPELRPRADGRRARPDGGALLLVGEVDAVVNRRRALAAAEGAAEPGRVSVADHDDRARALARTTEAPEGVMPGVRARDPKRRAVAGDRARLAVVRCVHDGIRALRDRQAVPDPRHRRSEAGPADRL